jgi:hypothetical protein
MDGLYDQLRIAVHTVWVRKWLAMGVAWGLCLAGWLAIALIPNSYESKARVFAEMQSILPQQVGITVADRAAELLKVKQTLTSTENLQNVVRGTDLNLLVASEADLAAQVAKLRQNIKITAALDNPNMIEISASSGVGGFSNAQNSRTASAIVQKLLDLFVEENLAGNRTETGQSLDFPRSGTEAPRGAAPGSRAAPRRIRDQVPRPPSRRRLIRPAHVGCPDGAVEHRARADDRAERPCLGARADERDAGDHCGSGGRRRRRLCHHPDRGAPGPARPAAVEGLDR